MSKITISRKNLIVFPNPINMIKKSIKKTEISKQSPENKRTYVSQTDVPSYPLTQALRVARAIADNYAKQPTKPLRVAQAMEMLPGSSGFKMLCGAAIAYGLTEGGYNAEVISLTPLAKRIVAPTKEGDDLKAMGEATLKPKVIREFLKKYNDSPLPSDIIGSNVLEEMGVPKDKTKQTFQLILKSAEEVGFITEVKGKRFVDLSAVPLQKSEDDVDVPPVEENGLNDESGGEASSKLPVGQISSPSIDNTVTSRVFITHGKNHSFLEPIKKLLSFGGFEAVVAAEKQTVSQPVPEKVMESMRSCGAAIIHIDAEQKMIDPNAKEHFILNSNVLIEIGAAMALYGKRFILLVKDGVQLPSNLQGLYEVRYSGEMLDSDVTIKLLEAINDIKSHSLPG